MALTKILATKPDSPFYRPPPVNVIVLNINEEDRTISWGLIEGRAKALQKKRNQNVIISDGTSVTKCTIFEQNTKNIIEGHSYILRGYALRGDKPPFMLHILPSTQFFKGPKVAVTPEIIEQLQALINPPAPLTSLEELTARKGLVSVRGEIVEAAAVRMVKSGKGEVPIRSVRLKQGSCVMAVSLWRDAALSEVSVGEAVTISHVRCQEYQYGPQLQSTSFTKIEIKMEENIAGVVMGVMETDDRKVKEILLEDDSTLLVSAELWEPFEQELENGSIKVNMEVLGKKIKKITKQ